VRPGDSVGVLDWDSNRFLEAFFAIPMMGVVLQTVNVRLSPEQVAYLPLRFACQEHTLGPAAQSRAHDDLGLAGQARCPRWLRWKSNFVRTKQI
jgi:hypothetical protein